MTTIHLTDAQRDTFAACGLIVIDGEVCPDCANPMLAPIPGRAKCVDGWLAPEGWRILTEPPQPVVTLTANCRACRGMGAKAYKNCVTCDASGRVTLGQFVVVSLLPVQEWASHTDTPKGEWVAVSPSGVVAVQKCDGRGLTTYPATKLTHRDPLPTPGQWVVELEQVKGEQP